MSRNGKAGPAGGWLEGDQWRAWLACIRVQHRHSRAGLGAGSSRPGCQRLPGARRRTVNCQSRSRSRNRKSAARSGRGGAPLCRQRTARWAPRRRRWLAAARPVQV